MQEKDALQEIEQLIADESERIARQQRRVERLSIQFGQEELREQAKQALADLMVNRSLLEVRLNLMRGDTAPAQAVKRR